MKAEREAEVLKLDSGQRVSDRVAVEAALEIRIVYGPPAKRMRHSLGLTLRTPGHDADLARGLLFAEGIIQTASDILSINEADDAIRIELDPVIEIDAGRLQRSFAMTASCGWCGRGNIDDNYESIPMNWNVSRTLIQELPRKLKQHQRTFQSTGGLHAAALFDRRGNLIVLREDVGRHNAVDQAIGAELTRGGGDCILAVSGRAGVELVAKAARFGVPVMVAVGAPTTLAIEWAERSGITLCGFVREGGGNCYTHSARITADDPT